MVGLCVFSSVCGFFCFFMFVFITKQLCDVILVTSVNVVQRPKIQVSSMCLWVRAHLRGWVTTHIIFIFLAPPPHLSLSLSLSHTHTHTHTHTHLLAHSLTHLSNERWKISFPFSRNFSSDVCCCPSRHASMSSTFVRLHWIRTANYQQTWDLCFKASWCRFIYIWVPVTVHAY